MNHIECGGTPPLVSVTIQKSLVSLFETKAYGFREVVLTCIIAWEDGITFDPVEDDFYACHPRAIYEQGIRPVLVAHKIPHMKSGPLNVAKNIKQLNENWAEGRRPESAAYAAVNLLRWV
jgi:hypothetical protein